MQGFRDWLQANLGDGLLSEMGVVDVKSFDYRERVRKTGFTTREAYKKGTWQNKIPLRNEFFAFQREAAAELVRELGEVARRVAGKPVPVGVNSYNLSPTQLATSHHADFFANEVQHYGVEETIPPLVYMLGTALGKPVFSTGSGHCWIKVGKHGDVTRVRRWIATAHAFGHYSMYAYKKWGFSKETGTQWYMTPIATYEPLCRFIVENAPIFDDYEPVAQVGVLYDNSACGKNRWGVRKVCRALHEANIPCGPTRCARRPVSSSSSTANSPGTNPSTKQLSSRSGGSRNPYSSHTGKTASRSPSPNWTCGRCCACADADSRACLGPNRALYSAQIEHAERTSALRATD